MIDSFCNCPPFPVKKSRAEGPHGFSTLLNVMKKFLCKGVIKHKKPLILTPFSVYYLSLFYNKINNSDTYVMVCKVNISIEILYFFLEIIKE